MIWFYIGVEVCLFLETMGFCCLANICYCNWIFLKVRAAFKHKTKVWTLTSSSIRNVNVRPFNSDIVRADYLQTTWNWLRIAPHIFLTVFQMNGNKEGGTPTKMNTWDKSTNSANRIDLSAV